MGTRTGRQLSLVEAELRPLQAADLFEQGMRQSKVAEVLGVTRQAVSLWHRAWREGGTDALLSKGPGGSSYLSAEQEARLEVLLRAGPMGHGTARMTAAHALFITDSREAQQLRHRGDLTVGLRELLVRPAAPTSRDRARCRRCRGCCRRSGRRCPRRGRGC
ncbi:helix-turn-helix domain-containing protein [Streptomyces sp. NBC_00841]|uniref:helix-turn-helix domain-containing protein n=1 Tax=Streptomyces sp. NBC_00841 TaxID=2975847 RepID=UPI003FA384CF